MALRHQATLTFRDEIDSDEAVAVVRYGEGRVVLALSLMSNGDVEVAMNKADALQLVEALRNAAEKA